MNLLVKVVVFVVVLLTGVLASAAPLVLGKRYPLNTKAERGTLVWQFVTFNRSITGGINIQLEVYNRRAKSLKYFDDYRDIVDASIQKNTISKFSLESSSVNFSSDRYANIAFQVSKLSHLYYIPLRVDYYDGFEDYLVRLYFAKGKFALSSRLLQQGKIVNPEPPPADSGIDLSVDPEDNAKDSASSSSSQTTPASDATEVEDKTILVEPAKLTPEEQKEQEKANEELRSFIETSPDESLLQELPEFGTDFEDPNFKDTSDILFEKLKTQDLQLDDEPSNNDQDSVNEDAEDETSLKDKTQEEEGEGSPPADAESSFEPSP